MLETNGLETEKSSKEKSWFENSNPQKYLEDTLNHLLVVYFGYF